MTGIAPGPETLKPFLSKPDQEYSRFWETEVDLKLRCSQAQGFTRNGIEHLANLRQGYCLQTGRRRVDSKGRTVHVDHIVAIEILMHASLANEWTKHPAGHRKTMHDNAPPRAELF